MRSDLGHDGVGFVAPLGHAVGSWATRKGIVVPEGVNVEVAQQLTEHGHSGVRHERWHRMIEIVEVTVLAVVAIATAWSGFQASKWDGRQTFLYGESSRLRVEAGTKASETGDKYVRNTVLFASVLFLVAMAQRIRDPCPLRARHERYSRSLAVTGGQPKRLPTRSSTL